MVMRLIPASELDRFIEAVKVSNQQVQEAIVMASLLLQKTDEAEEEARNKIVALRAEIRSQLQTVFDAATYPKAEGEQSDPEPKTRRTRRPRATVSPEPGASSDQGAGAFPPSDQQSGTSGVGDPGAGVPKLVEEQESVPDSSTPGANLFPFLCDSCATRFRDDESLAVHMRMMHPTWPG